ncbi:hypothetical protein BKA69DRAFT_360455 [Paraphysoderma sedebokerense]|nr:hypothetical protein BKA69DRAFT_360455 [Paraphysoderma sedebokerense]
MLSWPILNSFNQRRVQHPFSLLYGLFEVKGCQHNEKEQSLDLLAPCEVEFLLSVIWECDSSISKLPKSRDQRLTSVVWRLGHKCNVDPKREWKQIWHPEKKRN